MSVVSRLMELFPEFEGGKHQVGSEAEVGISINERKIRVYGTFGTFSGLGCTFFDFFFLDA